MELNDDNNGNKNSQNLKNEKSLIEMESIEELKEIIIKTNSSLSDKTEQISFLNDLKKKIFHSLYENHSYKNNHNIIREIIQNLEQYLLSDSKEIFPLLIETLESLMMMFLFHFDIHITKIGLELLKFLIDNLEESYSNELIEYFTKIIQLLNIKKQVNNKNLSFISSTIIYNICLGLYLIMSNGQILKENKKSFFNFIKKNINEINLIYFFFIPCDNNSIKYNKIFNNDEIKFIYEKLSEMLNKTYADITNNLPNKKSDVLYIKEKVNKIGFICKILNSITIEGNRTYILDNIIKNMLPICRKILETFNYFIELQNNELKISSETLENILGFFITIGVFSLENIIKTISYVNKMYNDYSYDYLSTIIYIVQELSKICLNYEKNKIKSIISLIIQIIEVVLKKNKEKNNNKLLLDIYELYKINKLYNILLKIDSNLVIVQNKYPNTYKFFIEEKDINYFEDIEKRFNEKNFDFLSQIYLNSIGAGNKVSNNYINKKSYLNCLKKFEDFKNSIKESLVIKDGFSIDKNIDIEKKELENKENVTFEEFESFFLKNSMEMFNEIYTK